jgi:hypothetical protein
LVEFLRARLDEDEATVAGLSDDERVPVLYASDDGLLVAPSRMLAEVEAKRRIIELHPPRPWHINAGGFVDIPKWHPICGMCGDREWYAVPAPCPTLLALVQPYADHPAFNPEWKL